MTSDENETAKLWKSFLEEIRQNAAEVTSPDQDETVEALRERVDRLELLVEEFGQATQLQEEMSAFIKDLKEEHSDLRNFRWWITTFASVMSASLFGLLIWLMVVKPAWFIELSGSLQVPLIIALGGGSIVLMTILIKGLYRSRSDRNQDDIVPDAIKILYQTLGPK